jgi:hypothetical protein
MNTDSWKRLVIWPKIPSPSPPDWVGVFAFQDGLLLRNLAPVLSPRPAEIEGFFFRRQPVIDDGDLDGKPDTATGYNAMRLYFRPADGREAEAEALLHNALNNSEVTHKPIEPDEALAGQWTEGESGLILACATAEAYLVLLKKHEQQALPYEPWQLCGRYLHWLIHMFAPIRNNPAAPSLISMLDQIPIMADHLLYPGRMFIDGYGVEMLFGWQPRRGGPQC